VTEAALRPVAALGGTVAGLRRLVAPSAPQPRNPLAALEWRATEVEGRPARYGVGGAGPPVVFLHGWAMGDRAYKRALRRITARGCQVFVPGLPGFAGTADLPGDRRSIEGYAAWVDAFMAAVGVDEPALVIGHSFGGGVGIALAHDHPERVRYLTLVNSIGGAAWGARASGALAERPMWDWASHFTREILPLPQGVEMLRSMRDDLVGNVVRNPIALLRVANLARRADLTTELAALRERGLPVLALTSADDGVIPLAAFEALCEAVGAEAQVVPGRHSWLLADPDTFGEVLANVVETQVREHRHAAAGDRADDVARRLSTTSVPDDVAGRLLDTAPPLWLMSERAEVLAADLALCHPPLRVGEVRAVARRVTEPDGMRLTVAAGDRPGLLADSAAVLAHHAIPVRSASAASWPRAGLALHAFTVAATPDVADWEHLGADLRAMAATGRVAATPAVRRGRASVQVSGAGDEVLVRVDALDRPGLLAATCRWLADQDVDIGALHAATHGEVASDVFLVHGSVDADALAAHLGAPLARTAAPSG
jgi:pimeloyl-ACP methyl ester carboxylesterase/glycine cleavage system regulatory protein